MNTILIYYYNTPMATILYKSELESEDHCEKMLQWYADTMDYDLLTLSYKHITSFHWDTCT